MVPRPRAFVKQLARHHTSVLGVRSLQPRPRRTAAAPSTTVGHGAQLQGLAAGSSGGCRWALGCALGSQQHKEQRTCLTWNEQNIGPSWCICAHCTKFLRLSICLVEALDLIPHTRSAQVATELHCVALAEAKMTAPSQMHCRPWHAGCHMVTVCRVRPDKHSTQGARHPCPSHL
jgi:hypothetical protein